MNDNQRRLATERDQRIADLTANLLGEYSKRIAAAEDPDIKLPFADERSYQEFGDPRALPVQKVDGVQLRLVNWADYRGWEVRECIRFSSASSKPSIMGYVTLMLGSQPLGKDSYTVRTADGSWERRDFTRVDGALRALIAQDRKSRS